MKFIGIEGLDGAGKSTQIGLLKQHLDRKGVEYEYLHFPRFEAPFYGDLVARFLRGEFGSVDQVDPYLVALIFAGDRADAKSMVQGWLDEGKTVILDRYVYSNIAFQCAKLDGGERVRLMEWILDFEFGYNALPRPGVTLFLDVPFSFTERKLSQERTGEDRQYLQGQADIHEGALWLQRRVREVYLELAARREDLRIVDCAAADGQMHTPEGIFDRILYATGL